MNALGRKIKITGTPPNTTVEIDGRPTEVISIDLHLDGNSLPTVVITPPVFEVDVYLDGHVTIDENTKRTLIALGWTPPGEQHGDNADLSLTRKVPWHDDVTGNRHLY